MSLPDDNQDDNKWVWPHPADMGTVLIAGVFLAGMVATLIWLFSSPEPFRELFGNRPAASAPANDGEVIIDLTPKK
jgi:hypothetical protein